jgi:KTSC domain
MMTVLVMRNQQLADSECLFTVRIPPAPPENASQLSNGACENGFEGSSMDWVTVDSSVFDAAAYLNSQRLLYLKFRDGDIYRYFGFPPAQYDEFLAADSKGRYFAESIRNKYSYEPVNRHTSSAN